MIRIVDSPSLTTIAPRRLETLVPQLMADEPVVALVGAHRRKSTLLRRLAGLSGATVLDLYGAPPRFRTGNRVG